MSPLQGAGVALLADIASQVGQPRTVNGLSDPDASCPCVVTHSPVVVQFHVHHVWPSALGGPDTDANTELICLPGSTRVDRPDGARTPIAELRPDDVVVGSDGRPDRIKAVWSRRYAGDVIDLGGGCVVTADHPVYTDAGWTPAQRLQGASRVVRLDPPVDDVPRHVEPTSELGHGDARLVSAPDGLAVDVDPVGVVGANQTFAVVALVERHVGGLVRQQLQVLDPVVGLVAVDVMDDLAWGQPPSEVALHDEAMFTDDAALAVLPDGDVPVPPTVGVPLALPLGRPRDALERRESTRVGAVDRLRSVGSLRADVGPPERRPALLAGVRAPAAGRPRHPAAPGAAVDVPLRKARRAPEVVTAEAARLDGEWDVPPLKRRWDAVDQVARRPYEGVVYDITVSRSSAFFAEGVLVHNCPNVHMDTHLLWGRWVRHGGPPPWSVRRLFPRYAIGLVERGYAAWQQSLSG